METRNQSFRDCNIKPLGIFLLSVRPCILNSHFRSHIWFNYCLLQLTYWDEVTSIKNKFLYKQHLSPPCGNKICEPSGKQTLEQGTYCPCEIQNWNISWKLIHMYMWLCHTVLITVWKWLTEIIKKAVRNASMVHDNSLAFQLCKNGAICHWQAVIF
jgi:hypothetical protein